MPTKIKDPIHGLINQQDRNGPLIVDAFSHFQHPPEEVKSDRQHYHKSVVQGVAQKLANKDPNNGLSPKVFVHTEDGSRYMLKPYHHGIHPGTSAYMRYPIMGWSESATQGLYHAGGIGNLVQRSHVAAHKDHKGRNHPMLAISLDPRTTLPIREMAGYQGPPPEEMMRRAFKIGMMDFLTNNNDRHGGNLLFEPKNIGAPYNIIAIDNDRAFQYKVPNRFDRLNDSRDNLFYYISDSPGMQNLTNVEQNRFLWDHQYMKHGIAWWKENGSAIRKELDHQLEAIRHPDVRRYIHHNFNVRADVLDKFAAMHNNKIDPGEYDPYVEGPRSKDLSVPMFLFLPSNPSTPRK